MKTLIRSLIAVGVAASLLPDTASGHGSLEYPKSRVLRVYEAMTLPVVPPWAAQAIAADGSNSYYTWNQLSRNFPAAANGDSQPYFDNIPDGRLASAGNHPETAGLPGHPGLSFSGLDAVSNQWEWPAAPVAAGSFDAVFRATAAHDPSFFKVWITKEGYNHRTPLKWSDLEYLGQPAHTRSGNLYHFTFDLPQRTGHHVLYCLWQRVDPAGEVFIATSDLQFGGVAGEPPVLSLGSGVIVQENAGSAIVSATLSTPAPAGGVTAHFSTAAGTAGTADFTATSGTLHFAAGEFSKSITIPITDDADQESDELFSLVLSNITGADAGQTSTAITIRDDDTPASGGYAFTIYNNWGTGWQGKLDLFNGGPASWENWTLEFDAPWTISTGSVSGGVIQSHVGNHYVITPSPWNGTIAANGTLTFDWVVNGSADTTPPANVKINGQLLPAATPAVAIQPVTRLEGDTPSSIDLTVTLERAHTSAIHVAYATIDGSARAGTDYSPVNGSLVFAPGELSKTISVPCFGNTIAEQTKTFTVALAGVSGQTPPRFVSGKQSALVTLTDDDSPPKLLLTGDSLLEGDSGSRNASFKLRLSRSPKPGETVSVNYATAAGTATSGIDFIPRSDTITFASGFTETTVSVPILGDTHDERLETFFLTLDSPVGCSPANTSATGQIIDEDTSANGFGGQRIVGYADMTAGIVSLPPANRVTHLMAAFANVNADGTLVAESISSWNALKTANPSLRILLSIGGWEWSAPFTAVANDPVKRAAFAESCKQYVSANGIDGIDLDWEWPGGGNTVPHANDRDNFTALVHAVRLALDDLGATTGKTYELTCYAPATSGLLAFWDLAALREDFDFFNVQGYDLHGPWDNRTGHQSGLQHNPAGPDDKLNLTEVLALYTAVGVPRSQLLVGAPFYGQIWNNAAPESNGLFQTATGSHAVTYSNIAPGAARNFLRGWDPYAKVPYLYDVLGNRQWISYDDPQSIFEKANYSAREGFAGVFFWQLGGDTIDRQLLITLSDSLALADDADNDRDGLPDSWEIHHYGNLTAVNATSDTDGDGMTSNQERIARTDPKDRLSVLRCGLHDPGTDHTVVGFDSKEGVTYRIERSYDLIGWTTLATVTGTGRHFHHHDATLPTGTPKAFYRVAALEFP